MVPVIYRRRRASNHNASALLADRSAIIRSITAEYRLPLLQRVIIGCGRNLVGSGRAGIGIGGIRRVDVPRRFKFEKNAAYIAKKRRPDRSCGDGDTHIRRHGPRSAGRGLGQRQTHSRSSIESFCVMTLPNAEIMLKICRFCPALVVRHCECCYIRHTGFHGENSNASRFELCRTQRLRAGTMRGADPFPPCFGQALFLTCPRYIVSIATIFRRTKIMLYLGGI